MPSEQTPTGPTAHAEAQKNRHTLVGYWDDEIQRAIRRDMAWMSRGADVVDRYRGIFDDNSEVFNILWANTEVLKPTVYNHEPEPEIERTFLEGDPDGETMAIVMERTIKQCMRLKGKEFHKAIKKARDDMLLPGRGIVKVCYDANFEDTVIQEAVIEDGETIAEAITEESKTNEECWTEYFYWKDFAHSYGRMWEEVWWVAFAKNYTREQLVEEFGDDKGNKIPLNGSMYDQRAFYDEEGNFDYTKASHRSEKFARVWEIWDKATRQVIVIAEGYEELVDQYDDPYKLDEFFPTPKPLYSVSTTGTLTPIPEYTMYQYQAEELNEITRRISRLTEALKARGIGDAEIKSLMRLFDGDDNEVIMDEEFSKLMQAGGVSGAVSWLPIEQIAQTLATLENRRRETLNIIYEITGIADIMRGASDPRETATAIIKKGQYGSVRVRDRQEDIQNYCKDLICIMGEVIAELFDPETLILMSGIEDRPDLMGGMEQMYALLQDDRMRDFTISIETDSTIASTDFERKQDLAEFFTALSDLMRQLVPAVEQGIIPMEVAKELLKYAARRFEVGRDLINALDTIGQQPEGQGQEQQEQDPMLQVAQIQAQVEMERINQRREEAMMDAQIEQAKLQLEAAKLANEMQSADADRQLKMAIELINLEIVKENRKGDGANASN